MAHNVKSRAASGWAKPLVTQIAYRKVMGLRTPATFRGISAPWKIVTWDNAQAPLQQSGYAPSHEAEWEYAARGAYLPAATLRRIKSRGTL